MVRVNDGTLPTYTTIQKTTRPKQNRGRIQNTMEHMERSIPLVANTHGPIPLQIQHQTTQSHTRDQLPMLPNRKTDRLLEQQIQSHTIRLVPKPPTGGNINGAQRKQLPHSPQQGNIPHKRTRGNSNRSKRHIPPRRPNLPNLV